MKRLFPLIAALLLAVPSASLRAQEAPADWIAKLGSRNYAEREAAARLLEKLGKAALPALRDAIPGADLETKRRAILLMEKIEDQMIFEEVTIATPVHLRFKDSDLNDALGDVEKQIGLRASKVANQRRIANLDTGAVPYWQAWRHFCVAAQLEERDFARSAAKIRRPSEAQVRELLALVRQRVDVHPSFSASRLEFAAEPAFDQYAADDRGSVRIRLKWHELDSSIDAKIPHAVFAAEVRTEPRLEVMSVPILEITKVIDDQGQIRTPASAKKFPTPVNARETSFLAAFAGEIQYGGLLQLKAIPWHGPPRSLKEVHGRVRLEVSVRQRMIEMPSVLKSVGKQVKAYSGVLLKILAADMIDEDDILLRVRLEHLQNLAPQSPDQRVVRLRPGVIAIRGAMDVALERLELVDRAGRKCRLVKSRYEQVQDGKAYEAELQFTLVGGKAEELTLVMTKPPRTLLVEMPFLVCDVIWMEKRGK